MNRAALTLIELMLSMALGLGILLMAFAVLRATQQAYRVATVERETNRLLMLGYRLGMAESDQWLAYDNLESAAGQELRAVGQPFAPITLPAPFWRLHPGDPRVWDRSGARTYRLRSGSPNSQWWFPDHAQVGGAQHGDAQTVLLPGVQAHLAATGGGVLAVEYLPGHLPIGSLRNSVAWGQDNVDNRNTFAHDGMAGMIFRNQTVTSTATDNVNDQVFHHAARWGRLRNAGKRYHLAPRPGWATLPTLANTAYAAVHGTVTTTTATGMIQALNPPPAQEIDSLQVYAGNPAFYGDDQQRQSFRLEMRRSLTAEGAERLVRVVIGDNESGREWAVAFRALSTTLRGARIQRGLDQ